MRSAVSVAAILLMTSASEVAEDGTSTITRKFVLAKPIERADPLYPVGSRYAGRGGWVRTSFLRTRWMLLSLLLAPALADAAPNTTEIIGSFVPAKPVNRPPASYPNDARFTFSGGWVKMAFCVDVQGAVANPVVASSSRAGNFEKSVFDALRTWRYEPARFSGEPIEQCGLYADFLFQMPGRLGAGARTGFAKEWRKADKLIKKGQLDEASALVEAQTPWNNYEEVRLILLRARIAGARGDPRTEVIELENAISWSQNLEPEVYADTLHRAFALNTQLGQTTAAIMNYGTLMTIQPSSISEEERRSVAQLVALVYGDTNLVTPMKIESAERSGAADGVWSTTLLRRKLGFEALSGAFDRVEVRCQERWYVAKVTADQVLDVAPDAHKCAVFVFGQRGAAMNLVEYPSQTPQSDSAPVSETE